MNKWRDEWLHYEASGGRHAWCGLMTKTSAGKAVRRTARKTGGVTCPDCLVELAAHKLKWSRLGE